MLAERFDQIPVLLPKETPGRVVKVTEEEDDKKKKKKNGTHDFFLLLTRVLDTPTTKLIVDPVISNYLATVRANLQKHKLEGDKQHQLVCKTTTINLAILGNDACLGG